MTLAEALATGALEPLGRLPEASNLGFVCQVAVAGAPARCVYKPVSGERALWDFPDTTLAAREVLTGQVAAALGWELVPLTVWREAGPVGPGMCQEWIDDVGAGVVGFFDDGTVPSGWLEVARGRTEEGTLIVLAHADDHDLQRLAVLDAIVNNADRKGGHLLRRPDGRLVGIDHGLTFHADPKLRTVLWGWAGAPIPPALLTALAAAQPLMRRVGALASERGWISVEEELALDERIHRLAQDASFPLPGRDWPSLPWPPL